MTLLVEYKAEEVITGINLDTILLVRTLILGWSLNLMFVYRVEV